MNFSVEETESQQPLDKDLLREIEQYFNELTIEESASDIGSEPEEIPERSTRQRIFMDRSAESGTTDANFTPEEIPRRNDKGKSTSTSGPTRTY